MTSLDPYADLQNIGKQMQRIIHEIGIYYNPATYDYADEDAVQQSLRISYKMALDCYLAVGSISKFLPLSSGILIRTLIEIGADMNHIHRDKKFQTKRAKSYIKSVDQYTKAMVQAAKNMSSGKEVVTQNINPWTTSSVRDRIEQFGEEQLLLYDYFSVFTHANPATSLLTGQMEENTKINVLRASIVNMLKVTGIMLVNNVKFDHKLWFDVADSLSNFAKKYPANLS